MAGVTAFFHRGLCPLCGGGFRRCRFETLLFTPTEERRQMPSRPAASAALAGDRLQKSTPVFRGVFAFLGSAAGNPLAWGLCWGKGVLA